MIVALGPALLAFLQSTNPTAAPVAPADVGTPAPTTPVEPFAGSLSEGLQQLQAACEAGEHARALEIGASLLAESSFARWRDDKVAEGGFSGRALRAAAPVLDVLDLQGPTSGERAAVQYALGVVHSRAGVREQSAQAFDRARELAGRGALRLDSIYNLGVLALEQGEDLRKSIPELNPNQPAPNAAPPPPVAPIPGAAIPGAPDAPDPLEQAIQAYLRARTEFIERLKSDWQDADTRANLELVQRRLKELDELKKKREQQQQEQENKDQQQKDQDQDNKDQKDKDQQDQDKSKDESKENPKDPMPDEKPPEEQDKPEPEPEDQPKPDENPSDEKKPDALPDPGEPQEKLLTKEEMMRLFDLLKQTEEQGKRLEQQLRQVRRAKVKKDW